MSSVRLSAIEEFRLDVMTNVATGALKLDVVDTVGRTPVVVALDEEQLATLMLRVANIGGYANVFSRGPGGVRQVSVIRAESSLYERDADDMTTDMPSGAVTIGAFLDYVAQKNCTASSKRGGSDIPAILGTSPRGNRPLSGPAS